MQNIHIFRLTKTMVAKVAELEKAMWQEPWSLKSIAIFQKQGEGLVATYDNKVIGYALLFIDKNNLAIEISRLGVEKKYQRKGVAMAILSKIKHLFKGNKKIKCVIGEHNLAAQLLLQRNGFMYISTTKHKLPYMYNNKRGFEDGYLFEYYLDD